MLVFATQQFRSFWLPIFQSFVINCKELQISQTVQINQLFQLFESNLYVRRSFLYGSLYANDQKCKQWQRGSTTKLNHWLCMKQFIKNQKNWMKVNVF